MKLMTRGPVAVSALVDLALHDHGGPVTLAEISERRGISLSYLEQLFRGLRRNALVLSVHGPGGGYRLGKSAGQISVADIVEAVDGNETKDGRDVEYCVTQELWWKLEEHVSRYLRTVSLQRLVEEEEAKHGHDKTVPEQVSHDGPDGRTFIPGAGGN